MSAMKAKAFIDSLCEQFAEEFTEVPGVKDLEVPFRQAVVNLPVGSLQAELNEHFHKFLKRIERNLKRLHMTALPSISGMDDSIEELAKSDLDRRTDIAERDNRNSQKMLCNYMVREPKKPSLKAMKRLDVKQRKIIYRMFLKKTLGRAEISDTLIRTVIQDFDDMCNISELTGKGKSKFEWLPMCNVLLQLTTGSRPLAFIRVLKVLFESIQNDVNKCIAKAKTNRAGNLAEILKKFVISSHMGLQRHYLKVSEAKMYCRYMSALLSFYVDLCAVRSSKIEQKKVYGREIAGFVGYILQSWPESVLEVILQLQGLEDEHYNVLLPLIRKSLEVKPRGKGHMYYLKYVLLMRRIKDSYGECEQIQEWNLETKVNVPAAVGFLDWLREDCPEALEHIPSEDKKFKKTKITKFLLEEAEDDLIAILLDGLGKEDDDTHENVVKETDDITMTAEDMYFLDKAGASTAEANLVKEDDAQKAVSMPTKEMYFLDKAGTSTVDMAGEKISSKSKLKPTAKKCSPKPIVLKTIEDMEQLVDTDIEQDVVESLQTYMIDPLFIKEKVKDPDDRKFLQSEIVSITSVGSIFCTEETNDTGELAIESDGNDTYNSSPNRPGKWMRSTSSTPNKKKEPKRKSKTPQKIETTDVSEIERSTDFCTSITSNSEDECKIKSVVRKVTPRKGKSPREMSEQTGEMKLESAFINKNHEYSATSHNAAANKPKAEHDLESFISNSESCISITDSETGSEEEMEAKEKDLKNIAINSTLTINTDKSLNSLHESSAEAMNIAIESENSDTSNQTAEVPTEVNTRHRFRKSTSQKKSERYELPKKQVPKKSEVLLTSSKTDGSMVETNLGHKSDPNTTLSSASDYNTTLDDSELDKTSKYERGKRRGSSYRTSDESGDALEGRIARRLSNKSLKNDTKDEMQTVVENANDNVQHIYMKKVDTIKASPRKISSVGNRVSGMHDESYGDVFCAPEGNTVGKSGGKTTTTMEEKFIGKAMKSKKSPKKSTEKNNGSKSLEISGSVSLFTDADNDSDNDLSIDEADGESSKRTKSTEEIIGIIEEIKGKIISPRTIKSTSKDNGKLNESMFTNDSIDSTENETNISVHEIKSPKEDEERKSCSEVNKANYYLYKKGINSKMNISSDNSKESIAKTADTESAAIGNKTPSKLDSAVNSEVIDLSSEESDEERDVLSIEENYAVSGEESDAESDKDNEVENENISKTVNGRSLGKVTPRRISADLSIDAGKCDDRSPNKGKTAESGNLTAINSSFTVQSYSDNSTTVLNRSANKSTNYIEIVTDSESEVECQGIKNKMQKGMIDTIKTPEKNGEKSKLTTVIKTPRSDEGYINMTNSPTSSRKIKGNTDMIKTHNKTDLVSTKSAGAKSPRKMKVDVIVTPEKTDVTEPTTPRSNRGDTATKNSPKSNIKMRTPKMEAEITPKSDKRMKTPTLCHANTEKVTTPKSMEKRTPSPLKLRKSDSQNESCETESPKNISKHKYVGLKSPNKSSNKTNPSVDSEDDFVPSSQKKPRIKSDASGLHGEKEAAVSPSSSIGSDEDINLIPDIGAHLRPDHIKSTVVARKSQYMPSIPETNLSHKKETESTPVKGSKRNKRMMQSPESGTEDNSAISRPRRTRNRVDSESAVETESDIDGSTRPKRLRSATKAAPTGSTMTAVKKGGDKKGKSNRQEVYEFQSETDITTDQSDTDTRSTKRSVGGRRSTAIKSKVLGLVTEEQENLLKTPPGKVIRQRKGSASTSKKAVLKPKDLHGTRKRRLSGELADSLASASTDSEVSFPKLVKPVAPRKDSKRLSLSAEPIQREHAAGSSTPGRRYTLRKK